MITHAYTPYRSKLFDSHLGIVREHCFHFLAGAVLLMILALLPSLGFADTLDEQHALLEKNGLDTGVVSQALRGRDSFRNDTFGDEVFWTDTLRLHEAIAGAEAGGVGPGISPATALAVGLKVDVDALSRLTVYAIKLGLLDLDDPAVTRVLLRMDAVVGLKGTVNKKGELESVGVTCALCHSTVDDSFAPGIGKRLDGWANRDLDPGLILSLAPDLSAFTDLLGVSDETARTVLRSWGPGKFDASLLVDGKAFRPDGGSAAVLIPPAFGLAGVNLHTWTGWGSVTHWNAFVAALEMGGQGTLYDPRLNDPEKFPIAVLNGSYDVRPEVDLVTPKLGDLQFYQLGIPAPQAPKGSFDKLAAERGEEVFNNQADCARCHVPPIFTEPGWNMHTPEEIGIDGFQAERGPENRYRTAPLKGLWTHPTRGYYHDGRFATLNDVIEHYNEFFVLGLTGSEKSDLVEYLKSL